MRLFYLGWILLALARISTAQDVTPLSAQLSVAESQGIEQLADVYHIDRVAALERYRTLLGPDFLKALDAAYSLEKDKAYEILALAIPKLSKSMKSKSVKGAVINILLKKRDFSTSSFQVLAAELEQLITSKTDNDEENMGHEIMEQQIASALARWLALPDPKITGRHDESGSAYLAFIKRAKQKAATMPNSSPY